MKKTTALLILVFFNLNFLIGQNNSGVKMKSFIPKNKAFDIYYPENFTIQEQEQNIVSIFNENKEISITISSYMFEEELDAVTIINLLDNYFISNFSMELKESDFREYKTSFDNLIECEFKENGNYWMWWAISKKNKIIIISLNKNQSITSENINLLRFMIDKLIIN